MIKIATPFIDIVFMNNNVDIIQNIVISHYKYIHIKGRPETKATLPKSLYIFTSILSMYFLQHLPGLLLPVWGHETHGIHQYLLQVNMRNCTVYKNLFDNYRYSLSTKYASDVSDTVIT